MDLTFGSVCSGIEAASVAWHPLGWRAAWLAEVDRAASEVLAHRFPTVPNHGDMTLLAGMVRCREIPAPDILVGGTPCQAFSVAGRREGLNDARGQLTLAFVDLADAIDRIRIADGKPPCIIVWENVPGVLSEKTGAFGCFLAGLAGESDELKPAGRKWTNAGVVLGPERAISWRTLDAQYFGLAQRRRRVFVVASARAGFDPAAILLEFEGVRRDSPPSRKAGEGVAGTLDARTTGGGFPGTDGACSGHVVPAAIDGRLREPDDAGARRICGAAGGVTWPAEIACTLNASFGDKQGLEDQHINGGQACSFPPSVSMCLNAGAMGRRDAESETLIPMHGGVFDVAPIAFSSKDYGGDATEDCSPTLRSGNHADSHANGGCGPAVAYAIQERAICENPQAGPDGVGVRQDDCAYTMEARQVPQAVAYSVALRGREGGGTIEMGDDIAGCLRASSGGGDKPHVLTDAVCVTGNITHTLKAEGFDASEDGTGRGQPIINAYMPARTFAADGEVDTRYAPRDICDALHTSSGHGNKAPLIAQPTAEELEAYRIPGNVTPYSTGNCIGALTSANDSSAQHVIRTHMAVRRLMPVECERLQGFPDGWTAVPTGKNGKPAADGPRYKQLGNSMATNCMNWIGRRIAAHLAVIQTDEFESLLDDDFSCLLA